MDVVMECVLSALLLPKNVTDSGATDNETRFGDSDAVLYCC